MANEPAYPTPNYETNMMSDHHYGLTKREHFAGLAMQARLSVHTAPANEILPTAIARNALECADALIAELER